MDDSFICGTCGKEHAGLITDYGFKLPDVVWGIPEPERSIQAKFDTDLCRLGGRYFIRCVLQVPFIGMEGSFGWGVWAEVPWSVFERHLEIYAQDGSNEPAHEGTLANAIPVYENTVGVPVLLQFGAQTKRPCLRMLAEDHSKLAEEQRAGIDDARYHEILNQLAS